MDNPCEQLRDATRDVQGVEATAGIEPACTDLQSAA
jgi:hypothetical protein